MRIQTRLFLGTAALVLALVGVQWWLHARQLRAIEDQLGEVATTVGAQLLGTDPRVFVERIGFDSNDSNGSDGSDGSSNTAYWVSATELDDAGEPNEAGGSHGVDRVVRRIVTNVEQEMTVRGQGSDQAMDQPVDQARTTTARPGENTTRSDGEATVSYEWTFATRNGPGKTGAAGTGQSAPEGTLSQGEPGTHEVRHLKLQVEKGKGRLEQFLVIHADSNVAGRIPIPVSPTVRRFELDLHRGLTMSAVLLIIGLAASGLMSRRLARPLQELALRSDELARGELGLQVPVTASGEIGDLQRAFNRMSGRLAELEHEREQWRQREHLVQLGDLARGLAHTLRNPLNTLGLAVDELAGDRPASEQLVGTARGQIRRIDRWLRSFLAIGAGDAATRQRVDLVDLVASVVLEAVQQGAAVELRVPEDEASAELAWVDGVPTALRAAVGNLVENAIQASPEGSGVTVTVSAVPGSAEILVRDHGPGLPEEVRERLFSPHVTTKVGGSGMGLFLARQLVVSMHQGELDVVDAEDGGTEARIRLGTGDCGQAAGDEVE